MDHPRAHRQTETTMLANSKTWEQLKTVALEVNIFVLPSFDESLAVEFQGILQKFASGTPYASPHIKENPCVDWDGVSQSLT